MWNSSPDRWTLLVPEEGCLARWTTPDSFRKLVLEFALHRSTDDLRPTRQELLLDGTISRACGTIFCSFDGTPLGEWSGNCVARHDALKRACRRISDECDRDGIDSFLPAWVATSQRTLTLELPACVSARGMALSWPKGLLLERVEPDDVDGSGWKVDGVRLWAKHDRRSSAAPQNEVENAPIPWWIWDTRRVSPGGELCDSDSDDSVRRYAVRPLRRPLDRFVFCLRGEFPPRLCRFGRLRIALRRLETSEELRLFGATESEILEEMARSLKFWPQAPVYAVVVSDLRLALGDRVDEFELVFEVESARVDASAELHLDTCCRDAIVRNPKGGPPTLAASEFRRVSKPE